MAARLINGGRLTGWKTRGWSSGRDRSTREGGTVEPSPNFRRRETVRSGAGWRARDAVTSGRSPCSALDTLTPVSACAGAYVHSCHSSIRDLQSAVRCRGCIYRGGLLLLLLLLFALLSSFVGCLIARVNKFTKLRFSSLFFFFSLGNLPLHFANNF